MKIFYLLVIGMLCLTSCQEELDPTVSPTTRAVIDEGNVSTSNPNLLSNWEDVREIKLNTIGNGSISNSVTAPWITGAITHLPSDFCYDIKKENGWKMLFHTFKREGLDAKQNYICFYNQLTGYVKIFYYYEGSQRSQGTQWYVKTGNNENTHLFSLADYAIVADTAQAEHNMILCSNLTGDPTNGINPGWNGFEFEVPYCTDYRNMTFTIGAYDRNITKFNFLGKEESETVGTITTTSRTTPGILKTIANLGGKGAKDLVGNLTEKVTMSSKLKDLISSISSSDYASAISAGLGAIFGKTTTTTSDVKLTTTGTIELSGTGSSQTTTDISPVTFNLYQIMNPGISTRQVSVTSQSLVYDTQVSNSNEHFIGVWSSAPSVIYNRFARLENIQYRGNNQVSGDVSTPKLISYRSPISINPDVKSYITSSQNTTVVIKCDTLQGQPFKKNVRDIEESYSSNYKKQIFYKDADNSFYEAGVVKNEVGVAGYTPFTTNLNSKDFWYDWGIILNGKLLAVTSLKNTFSYLGKTIVITQSRTYNASYDFDIVDVEDYDVWYNDNKQGNCVINDHAPGFGIFIEEEDLYLYGK